MKKAPSNSPKNFWAMGKSENEVQLFNICSGADIEYKVSVNDIALPPARGPVKTPPCVPYLYKTFKKWVRLNILFRLLLLARTLGAIFYIDK